jgi:RNA polymerase-binding transcription factor DksA
MHKLIARIHRHSSTRFRAILLDRKVELLLALALNVERFADLQAQESDLDKARYLAFRAMRVNRVLYGKLRRTQEGLDRIDSGTFGTCLHCGKVISSGRL